MFVRVDLRGFVNNKNSILDEKNSSANPRTWAQRL